MTEPCIIDGPAGWYDMKPVGLPATQETLSQWDWFRTFLSGYCNGSKLEWMQPVGDESKRVTFAENQPNGA